MQLEGISGVTHDLFRPLLEGPKDLHLLFSVCDLFAKGQMPREVVQAHQIGTDDSSPRRARHCGRRSHQESHGQYDRVAVETSGESRHSSFPMCIVDQIRVRLHCTCTSRCDRSRSRGHQPQPLLASMRTMLGLDRVAGATNTPVCALVPLRTSR